MVCLITFIISGVNLALDFLGKIISKAVNAILEMFKGIAGIIPIIPSIIDVIDSLVKGALDAVEKIIGNVIGAILSALNPANILESIENVLKELGAIIQQVLELLGSAANELTGAILELCKAGNFFDYLLGKAKGAIIAALSSLLNDVLSPLDLTPEEKAKAMSIIIDFVKGCDPDLNGENDEKNKNNIAQQALKFLENIPKDYCGGKSPLMSENVLGKVFSVDNKPLIKIPQIC
jgi:phage-related protein